MEVEFKITKKNKSRSLRYIYFLVILYIAFVVWGLLSPFALGWRLILVMTVFELFIQNGPGIYLYREYIKYNNNCILMIDRTNKSMSYQEENGELINSGFNDVEKINVYIPPNNYRDRGAFTSMEVFSYARFELKDGREFYITCLMIPNLRLKDLVKGYFSEVPVEFHRWWLFPSVRLCNHFRRKKKYNVESGK